MHIKTPISSTKNPIFILLILINETYALIPTVRSVLKFYVVFLNMLVFKQFGGIKTNIKHVNQNEEGEEGVGF